MNMNFIPGLPIELSHIMDLRASIALDLVKAHSLVAGEVDGEDSAGRQKARRLTPAEVANAAIETADALVQGFIERGWLAERSMEDIIESHALAGRLRKAGTKAEFGRDE